MMPRLSQIADAIESAAPRYWQEDFDNTGWQILIPGRIDTECTGLMICVDATVEIIEETCAKGCNMLLTHHPLLFRGIKCIDGDTRVGMCIVKAIENGLSVYSCHTSIDNSPEGVSFVLAKILGLRDVKVLAPGKYENTGIGVTGILPEPMKATEFVELVKKSFHSPVARCSGLSADTVVEKVAIGGGACSDLIPAAIKEGAGVMITSDVKHNMFLDYNHRIGVIDLGHFETEECTKEIFYNIIREKFPNFVPYYSLKEKNPITYL